MDVREKLVELLCKMISPTITVGEQADYLIANGVTIQPRTPVFNEDLSDGALD